MCLFVVISFLRSLRMFVCMSVCVIFVYFLLFADEIVVFFFKQKTAYWMRISDWSSDVCSSDLGGIDPLQVLDDGRSHPDTVQVGDGIGGHGGLLVVSV